MANRSKITWSTFDGRAMEYELCEEQILSCMRAAGLKQTILHEPTESLFAEKKNNLNAESYFALTPHNKSLGLIFRDTKDKGLESLRVLIEHCFAGCR